MKVKTTTLKRPTLTKKIKLYVCILYPGGEWTPQMTYNAHMFHNVPNLDIEVLLVEGNRFSHRHPRHVSDPDQCMLRNQYLDSVPNGEWLIVLDSDEAIFGALDRLPDMLFMMNEQSDTVQYAGITELLPDGTLKIRPRIIKKVEGLKYGGPKVKHDWIDYEGENWIDVNNTEAGWILSFLGFFHQKNGIEINLYPKKHVVEIPDNLRGVDDLPTKYHDPYNHGGDTHDIDCNCLVVKEVNKE